ncbi:MAG: zinc ABC transporter substrate-binding protein [Acidobacteriota bacterium]|nr:zinc ABC transporter substrate-binding protein [Acidobacteriota bacterium]MDQ7088239.1 zinc ABC transporter substrate-binding protein [Acidobacteriota bacterium]
MLCILLAAALAAALVGCAPADRPSGERSLRVLATTGIVADLARNLVPEGIEVEALMGPGVDPHLYKASEGDVRRLAGADLVLFNGLHLEGKMGTVLSNMARDRRVVALAETLPAEALLHPPGARGQADPHVWFDVSLWSRLIDPVAAELSRLAPASAEAIRRRAEAYARRLATLDAWVTEQIATLPPERRVLVTAHDAFGYFGRRYGMEVVGLQGMSTLAEAGLADMTRVARLVAARRLPSVFVESSVPRRNVEALVAACADAGHRVRIGGQLYSDALGPAGSGADSYEGMVRHNVQTIVEGLR